MFEPLRKGRTMSESSSEKRDAERTEIPAGLLAEFEAAQRRTLEERFRYSFIKTYKPVMDDATYRSWDTMAEYRQWCAENLPPWLGYGPASDE
jgi:hypothetical protein